MNDKEAIQMMQRCIMEMETQRATISRLQPKADAYDNMAVILQLLPQPSQGYGEDLVWQLKKAIEELQPKPPVEPAP